MGIKLTPKKVALAIGVSESSMKRWCDRGLIDFNKTAGGHRRISQSSVVQFLRNSDYVIVRAELLGLPEGTVRIDQSIEETRSDFLAAILDGQEESCKRMLIGLYLAGHSVADLGDHLISPMFLEIGRKWECNEIEVYKERRACEITVRILHDLRCLIPTPSENAPLAIGGAPQSDDYILPTTLVEMVLKEQGWRSQSLGSQLPLATLAQAAIDQQPRLFWLSVSHVDNELKFLHEYNQFRRALRPETFLVVGGRALDEALRSRMQYSALGDSLNQLQSLANSISASTSSVTGHPAFVSSAQSSVMN